MLIPQPAARVFFGKPSVFPAFETDVRMSG